jgi:hypothetical protein
LIGDSHAAQLFFMFESAVTDTKYQLHFINDGSIPKLTHGKEKSETLDFIINHIKPGDIVALTFHRGHLNSSRDKHIPIGRPVEHNALSIKFKEAILQFQSLIQKRGGTTLFIRDTPLMASVSTSPSCRLQIELFGDSMCKVSNLQDRHTRIRQDMIYDEIIQLYPNNCTWDPLPALYKGSEYIDVVNSEGEYVMWDWNHISKATSQKLATTFLPELLTCIDIAQDR